METRKVPIILITLALLLLPIKSLAETDAEESWLPTLQTDTPEEGFELAVTLARKGVTTTQSNPEVLHRERAKYSEEGEDLMMASQVIALHFQTIAAANDYWR